MLNLSPINLLLTVVNLLVLLALMKKFLYKPVLSVIAKRKEMIEGEFAKADAAKMEAEQLKEQYASCMADMEKEQEQCIEQAKKEARVQQEKILANADEQAKQILSEAKRASEEEKNRVMQETKEEMAKLVVSAAAKIVSDSVNEKSNGKVYDEFLKKAGEMSAAGSR